MEPQMTATDLADLTATQAEWDAYSTREAAVAVPDECPACDGHGLDRQCTGHPVGLNAMLYCGCPLGCGDDLTVTLGHSDLAALAA